MTCLEIGPPSGCRLRPVNEAPSGADWMTRSLAKTEWCGAAMERDGGGPLRRPVWGILFDLNSESVPVFGGSSPSGILPPLLRASIIKRCCSRTSILRCSCCCIWGLEVLKPGERHASPTSSKASFEVKGRADNAPAGTFLWVDKSRRLGR